MKRTGRSMGTKETTRSIGRTTKTLGDGAWAGFFASRTQVRILAMNHCRVGQAKGSHWEAVR